MKKFLSGAVIAASILPWVASAQFTDLDSAIDTVAGWIGRLIPFLLLLATLYFFWGLTKFILKAGNEEAQAEAKQIMIWGVVAVFVMISFWGLVGFLSATIGASSVPEVITPPDFSGIAPTI